MVEVQSRTLFTSFANFKGSCGLTEGSWRWWSKAALNCSGVCNSLRLSRTWAMEANHISTSSWLWPLIKQLNCPDFSLCPPTCKAKNLSMVPFLHSRVVLSHCTLACTLRRSVHPPMTFKVQARRSQHQLLSLATKLSERTIAARCPCAMTPWASSAGRIQPANSLLVIFKLLGNLYFPLSIPSKIIVTI